MTSLRISLCALALLSTTSCRSMLEPSGFVGTYNLTAVNTHPLPATVSSGNSGCSWSADQGSLTLGASAFSLAVHVTQACPGSMGVSGLESIGGGLSITGRNTVSLNYVTDPTGSTATLGAALDDTSVTITVPTGLLEAPALLALRFTGRNQAFGCAC